MSIPIFGIALADATPTFDEYAPFNRIASPTTIPKDYVGAGSFEVPPIGFWLQAKRLLHLP